MGPIVGAAGAGSLVALAYFGLGLLPSAADYWYSVPFAFLAAGGSLTFFTTLKAAFLVPRFTTLILTANNVLFDVSAGAPLVPS